MERQIQLCIVCTVVALLLLQCNLQQWNAFSKRITGDLLSGPVSSSRHWPRAHDAGPVRPFLPSLTCRPPCVAKDSPALFDWIHQPRARNQASKYYARPRKPSKLQCRCSSRLDLPAALLLGVPLIGAATGGGAQLRNAKEEKVGLVLVLVVGGDGLGTAMSNCCWRL
jgi:hypothetical protein